MHSPIRQQVLERVLHVIRLARPLVALVGRRDRDLASQIRRALSSVALNVAEGFGSAAGNSRLRFETARGSLYEAEAGLRVAVAWGHVAPEEAAETLAASDHLSGRIFELPGGDGGPPPTGPARLGEAANIGRADAYPQFLQRDGAQSLTVRRETPSAELAHP